VNVQDGKFETSTREEGMKILEDYNRISALIGKRVAPLVPAAALVVACFFLGRVLWTRHVVHAEGVVPFVLDTEVYTLENNPNREFELFSKKTIARRSDGSTVFVGNVGPIAWGQTGRKITFMDGTIVSVVDSLGTKTSWPGIPQGELAQFRRGFLHPPANCVRRVGETLLGYAEVVSERVAIVRESPLQGGGVADPLRFTYYRAPNLACETLEYQVEEQAGGSWRLITKSSVVSLRLEEPDPGLFDVPSTYTESRPSELQHKLLQKMGIPEDAAG
jgi:hypothetical protein